MGSKRREKSGEKQSQYQVYLGWLVLFVFVSVYLRQDYLPATLQINPSVVAI